MSLTENLLRATLHQLQRDSEKRFVGIRADGWVGDGQVVVGEETFSVQLCQTPLAVRAAMDGWPTDAPRLVIVTPCSPADLGCDVEARVLNNRFQPADAWQAVLGRFGAERLAPNVPRDEWLRDVLLSLPDEALPRLQTSTVLDLDTVRLTCLQAVGLPAQLDLRGLLAWAGSEAAARLTERATELSTQVRVWIEDRLGAPGGAIVDAVLAGHGHLANAIGLVMRLLDPAPGRGARADATVTARAEGRLEGLLGGRKVRFAQLKDWVEAAEDGLLVELASRDRGVATLEAADRLLDQLGVRELAGRSHFLREGRRQREHAFAAAVRAALEGPKTSLAEVDRAAQELHVHKMVREDHGNRSQAIVMAERLLRWLRSEAREAHDFRTLALEYVEDLSFVDQARELLDYPGPLQTTLRDLWRSAFERREGFNRRFADALAQHTAAAATDEALVSVEHVIDRVVAPLAQQSKVLLLVLDGMSVAVFHELASGFVGWSEVGPTLGDSQVGRRRYGVAALPTVTEVSRTSLLCGRITNGNQGTEKTAFAANPALRVGKRAAVLFHKDDLTDARVGLAESVAQAIAGDDTHHVVGVVLNAIDDWLGKGDQDAAPWTVERIKPLMELLQCAASGNRALVVTSDHGHVREHTTQVAPGDGGTRFRRSTEVRPGEIRLRGPRVAASDGDITAPWTETMRYSTSKQNGYHGGATPQEVLVPLCVFVRNGVDLAGYDPVPTQQPAWWDGADPMPTVSTAAPATPKIPPSRGKKPPASSQLPFGDRRRDQIDALLASSLYAAQAASAGRMRVEDARVRAILLAVAERGHSLTEAALAAKLQLPQPRVTGYLAALRRTLNLDGVESIELDAASRTIKVNWSILMRQFGLEEDQP
jgi:hypothetical protein